MNQARIRSPKNVVRHKRTPVFDETSIPAGLLKDHATKESVWGVIHVTADQLGYFVPERNIDEVLDARNEGVILPTELHRVEPVGNVSFFV